MHSARRLLLAAALTGAATVVAATASGALVQRGAPRAGVAAADWTTYHHDALRTSDGSVKGTFTSLHASVDWRLPTATASERTDAIYASPLVAGHVAYVATLENRVYAISLATGRTVWSRTLGTSYTPPTGVCGDIGPTVGVVSTGTIDEPRSELFEVADVGTGAGDHVPVHRLFGLSLATGRVLLDRDVDPPGQVARYLLQRASLALDGGRVLFGFGGNDGDCGTYHGWVVSVPVSGTARIDRFEVASGEGQGKGAVWMGGGAPSVAADGDVFVADGNGDATSAADAYDDSDAVLKLSPTMRLLDYFAPTTWYADNATDADLGSGQPELLADGLLLQVGKTHTGYVLSQSDLGHIDASVRTFPVCTGMGKAAGGDAVVGSLVVVPCSGGLDAVRVTSGAPYGTTVWTQPHAHSAPPVYAAGLVWALDGSTSGSTLYALDPANGDVTLQFGLGAEKNHFPTPAVGDNMVLVASSTALLGFAPTAGAAPVPGREPAS